MLHLPLATKDITPATRVWIVPCGTGTSLTAAMPVEQIIQLRYNDSRALANELEQLFPAQYKVEVGRLRRVEQSSAKPDSSPTKGAN